MSKRQMHINLTKEETAKYVFVPGSIERVERIAQQMDNPKFVTQKREYTTWEGYIEGERVIVTSTGIGGPSAGIAMEELVKNGADTFIRIGSCATLSPRVKRGDVVIPNGVVRMDGVSYHYAKAEFPAVPNYEILNNLVDGAKNLGHEPKVGINITKDSFYTQTEPHTKPVGEELIYRWNSYIKAGAETTSMEEATLFVAGSSLGVRVGLIMVCATNYETTKDHQLYTDDDELKSIKAGIEGMRLTILRDREKAAKAKK